MTDVGREYAFAAALILGTLFVTPGVGLALNRVGVPLTPALLGVLTLVFAGYGAVLLWTDAVRPGLLVAVLVSMTVGANVPLGAMPAGITIGPSVFVVDLLLLLLVAITLPTWRREHVTLAHGLLALYLVWSFLLVVLAPGPRPDVMLWYALHVTRFGLVFALVTRGIVDDWLSAGTALGVVVLTVLGHALVASVQVFTGPLKGLTVLGMSPRSVDSLPLGPLGSIPTGPYVGGFTGGSPFAVLLTIVIPVVAASYFRDDVPRVAAVGGVAWLAFLVQLTAWDAARGALLVAFGLLGPLFGWWATGVLSERVNRLVVAASSAWLAVRWRLVLGTAIPVAALWQLRHLGDGSGHGPVYLDPNLGQAFARSVDVPGFSTRNLAIRIHQYVGWTDTFLQYPLTGIGGANYNYISLSYASRSNMMHNLYVGIFAETGLVGGVLFFGAMAYAIYAIWLGTDRNDDPLYLGLLAGIGGLLALQFFQPQYLRVTSFVSVWALLGIACGRHRREVGCPDDDRWARAWSASRGRASIVSARCVRFVATAPERGHAALRSSRLVSAVVDTGASSVTAELARSGRASLETVWEASGFETLWRRVRRYCAHSRLLD